MSKSGCVVKMWQECEGDSFSRSVCGHLSSLLKPCVSFSGSSIFSERRGQELTLIQISQRVLDVLIVLSVLDASFPGSEEIFLKSDSYVGNSERDSS